MTETCGGGLVEVPADLAVVVFCLVLLSVEGARVLDEWPWTSLWFVTLATEDVLSSGQFHATAVVWSKNSALLEFSLQE